MAFVGADVLELVCELELLLSVFSILGGGP